MIFSLHQEYYLMATTFLNTYSFKSPIEKEVWSRHTEGIVPVKISEEIKRLGLKANKDTIYKIIRRLENKMKLGLL